MRAFYKKRVHIAGTRQTNLDQARGRLILISTFFIMAYVIVVARAADLSIIQGLVHSENQESEYISSHNKSEQIFRSDIIDRNGVILARSIQTASLFADASLILEPVKVAKDLQKIFPDISYGSLLQKLQSKKKFVWLQRNITPEQQSKILYLGYPGLNFREETSRIYPQGSLAVHLVGETGIDGQGLAGIEANFDEYLKKGNVPLMLTLDVRLQHVLKREISRAVKEFSGKGGAGIIMDVETGEILAATSLPDFDPQTYQKAKTDQKFNRFSLGVYELGSVFKVFSTAALIEKTKAGMGKKFDVREPIVVGRHKIRDYHPEKRILTLPEVFIHSSNIGSAMMGQEVGTKELKDFYEDLGLLNVPDFEISELGKPLVPEPWTDVNTLTTSFGHGIAVSPLQLVTATSSIVNGGIAVKPKIIKGVDVKNKNKPAMRVVSAETSHRMRQLLRLVVTEGTGSKADVAGYLVGGKTGTAEKPGRGGYDRKKLISSFLGAFPMDNPKYVIFAMVDEPQGTKASYGYATGGWVGAPVVKRVVSSMVSIMGISPSEEKQKFEGSLVKYVKTKEEIKKERQIEAH